MSAQPDALALLRQIRAALATAEGRAVAREIASELKRADEEATQADPIGADVDATLARARRSDRARVRRSKKA